MDFVLGHPRSGTTFVAQLLAGATGLAAHELLARLSPDGVSAPTAFYEGRLPAPAIHALLDRYASGAPPARIDSNWKLTWILPILLEKFPDARIVHLTRDPRHTLRSCLDLDYYGDLTLAPDRSAGWEPRNFWLSHMPRIRHPNWDTLSQLERNCAFWTETHRLAESALSGLPRARTLRLEDLVRDEAIAADLFHFLDVPVPPTAELRAALGRRVNERTEVKRRLAELRPPWPTFAEWPPEARRVVVEMCGETAQALGYDPSQW